jgi:hypothetical protein
VRADAPKRRARYNPRVTRFAVCFLLVFAELATGGLFALAVPPFFKIERGFYKSTASVYLACGAMTAFGFGALAWNSTPANFPGTTALWVLCGVWIAYCLLFGLYLWTLWSERGLLRARTFSGSVALGLIALAVSTLALKPAGFGFAAAMAYVITAIASSIVLGLTSGAMMFGHWYLIDLSMPVDYLKSFVRLLGGALVAEAIAIGLALALAMLAGSGAIASVRDLFDSHLLLLIVRVLVGPVATFVLTWMCWQTLKIPQTMAATGLLYIAVMSALVGEMLGRFILFRTSLPI